MILVRLPLIRPKLCFVHLPPEGKAISKAKTENVNDKRQSVMKQAKPARGEAESMGVYKAASGERTA